ncbi:MAG: T9SS type A sorting domain-containing protein [Chlorobi bacterium]|nr:T9SS type A sorting domain-containing protein [Chlorobiota bacterium]
MKRKYLRLILTSVLFLATTSLFSQSLYLIRDINAKPTPVQAYDIVGDDIVFQAEYDIPYYGYGAVGMAIDSDSAFLFITYENSDTIQLLDATLMDSIGFVIATGATNLAGIAYDKTNKHVYALTRETDSLYSFSWDASTLNLELDEVVILEDATAWGIFLDEWNEILYVANGETITYYSTSDWSLLGTYDNLTQLAINVEKDLQNDYLFYGGGYAGSEYITRYDLSDETQLDKYIGFESGVVGITINQLTGYIYITTGLQGIPGNGANNVMVYDTDLNLILETNSLGGDPTDIATALVYYNPLNLNIDTVGCVVPGGSISYNICYNNQVAFEITGVEIVAHLPDFTAYVSSTGGGTFNSTQNTVSWDVGNVPAWNPEVCLGLTLDIAFDLPVPSVVELPVTINGEEIGQTTKTMQTPTCLIPQAFFASDSAICYGDPGGLVIMFGGVPPWDLVYSDGSSTDTIFNVTESPYYLEVNTLTDITYDLLYVYGGNGMESVCYSSATVFVNPLPEPAILGSDTVCAYSFWMEYSTYPTPGHAYDWDISGGVIASGQNSNTVFVDWLQDMDGSISVNETVMATGCEEEDIADVKIYESPFINFVTNDTTLCPIGDTLLLFPMVIGGTSELHWTCSDVSSQWNNYTGDSIYVFTSGVGFYFATFYLYMINDNGCYDSDSIKVVFDFTACEGGVREQTDNTGIRIYPVPANNRLELEFTKPLKGPFDFYIVDALGKKAFQTKLADRNGIRKETIDISSLKEGVYFVEVFGDEVVFVKKIIVR